MRSLALDMRIWRSVYRLSQQAAADHLNVSVKTWQRWEREECRPTEDHHADLNWLIAQPPPGWLRDA